MDGNGIQSCARQQLLPLDRKERFTLIDRMQPKGLSRTTTRGLRVFLRCLEYCSGSDGSHAALEVIAAKASMTSRTARRYKRLAKELGIIVIFTTIDPRSRGQGRDRVAISWDALRTMADQSRPANWADKINDRADKINDRTDKKAGSAVVLSGRPLQQVHYTERTSDDNVRPKHLNKHDKTTPSTPPRRRSGSSMLREPWAVVERNLQNAGLTDAQGASRLAQQAGLTPEVALEIIAHYQAHSSRWDGPGALHFRLRTTTGAQAIDKGWPPPCENFLRQGSEAAAERRRSMSARHEEERLRRNAATAARLRDLEDVYGRTLDGLTDEQLQQLGRSSLGDKWEWVRKYAPETTREILLERVASTALLAAEGNAPTQLDLLESFAVPAIRHPPYTG